ncbi:DNA polymerase I [Natronoglycomyces albus]|uniref:DNA polymerase I n=1 Tax=Natronoglycomyces albus TaxID=2811108 RepID=A0A895XJF5_9ACTN|nr:DNA polymerase I [Natronoglycomyces albus]QSB03942.1 DNA polymerase I [Natronoglycomyces albus]
MASQKTRLLLIDGHSMAFRAFFALPAENFSTSTGQTTNAIYGFASMLIGLLREERPTHVAVAFDVSRHTFRTEKYADYKAGRDETPQEFKSQIPLIKELLDAFNICWIEKATYEADDIIATLAAHAQRQGWETLISSGDRDAIQLVNDTTTLLYPVKGVTELKRYTPESVEEKYLVRPDRYRDLAALVGEKSDNLSGVPGVGGKTAAKWINKYGSLEQIIDSADSIGGKVGQSFRDHLDDVRRNYDLNRLLDDVDLDRDLADVTWQGWSQEATNSLFDTLEFRGLGERLNRQLSEFSLGDGIVTEPEDVLDLSAVALEPGNLGQWFDDHATGPIGIAYRGTFAAGGGEIEAVALAAGSEALWFEPSQLNEDDESAWATWLADCARPKVLHNLKHFLWGAASVGWPRVEGMECDTLLAAYLVRPEQRGYELSDLCQQYLGRTLDEHQAATAEEGTLAGLDEAGSDTRVLLAADCAAAAAIAELAVELRKALEERHVSKLASTLEYPVGVVLANMETVGIAADDDHFSGLEDRFSTLAKEATDEVYRIVGKQFNLRSPKQLQQVLFEDLGMPKTKRTKTGYTTDAEALQQLFAKTGHPSLEQLLRFRDSEKLKQIVAGLRGTIQSDGRIHTTFHQTVAATGRLSSIDPNLQNVPVRSQAGRDIRDGFVVGSGYDTLMTIDYSQIEMRIMAHLSQDEGLIDAFRTGEDLHSTVAAAVFSVPTNEVSAEQRRRIKAMSYGLAYGLSPYGLSQQLGISAEEARQLTETYFERFGGVRDYLHRVVEKARHDGYTETMMGRRRYFPELMSDNRQRREMAERAALNAPIQGTAADIMKVAMLKVDRELESRKLDSRVLLQVHDELVIEVAKGEREQLEQVVSDAMGAAGELSVPLAVSAGYGRTWDEAAH